MNDILHVGPSLENTKRFTLASSYMNVNFIANMHNWASASKHKDTFRVSILDGICTVTRIDTNTGWGMNLQIYARKEVPPTEHIPVYYINLDKDTDRRKLIHRTLSSIFYPEDIHRIPGVYHKIGREGCRLAHIKAHETAISRGHPYYIICEDDIKPIVELSDIAKYIRTSIASNPDLVLFEQGGGIEHRIQMVNSDVSSANLYRIFGGGNNTGCYICSRDFGQKLINHWKTRPNRHIDHSWQPLWKDHVVYFHRPQLFIQRAGQSNQSDIDWRDEAVPFNWDIWEKRV